jgi:hypothetical protein
MLAARRDARKTTAAYIKGLKLTLSRRNCIVPAQFGRGEADAALAVKLGKAILLRK